MELRVVWDMRTCVSVLSNSLFFFLLLIMASGEVFVMKKHNHFITFQEFLRLVPTCFVRAGIRANLGESIGHSFEGISNVCYFKTLIKVRAGIEAPLSSTALQ